MTLTPIFALLMVACDKEPNPQEDTGGSSQDSETPDSEPGGESKPDTDPPDSEAPEECGSASGALPSGLTELAWDDGKGVYTVSSQGWSIGDLPLAAPIHEQVRFDLEGPALIYGFSVQYASAPAGPAVAGIYPDFGYNGFDMWHFEPLWQGSLCPEEVTPGEWVDFVLPEPLAIDQPGLVYVGNYREDASDPEWLFDGAYAGDGSCQVFSDCHSALNLPDEQILPYNGASYYYWPGVTVAFQYDFMVRLYVEYTDPISDEDKLFQPLEGLTTGARAAWGDFDGDGWEDLLIPGALYRNQGDGTFADVTAAAGLSGLVPSGGIFGDYDNDGCLDLFAFVESYSSGDLLLHSQCDGTFADVTAAAGISDLQSYNGCGEGYTSTPTAAAAWWDIDADGLLDLYQANFICWTDYTYYTDTVWHNEGGGLFSEWTGMNGFLSTEDELLAGRGANPIDHDRDGDVDLLVNNYVLHPNLLYENQGGGAVSEEAQSWGLDGQASNFSGYIYYGHTIGTAWGDLDNDGDFDNIQANLAHPRYYDFSDKTQVLLNDGEDDYYDNQGNWDYPAGDAGLRYQETHSVPALGDFDQDGALDLVITAVYDGRPTDFYWGVGDGTFVLDTHTTGVTTRDGWGLATADFDRDGDLDIASSDRLFVNTLEGGGAWLQVAVVGQSSNRAGVGATVEVAAGDARWIRAIGGGTGQGDQDALSAHFGLGDITSIDSITVTFPGGDTVVYEGPFDPNQKLWLSQGGAATPGWDRPVETPP